MTDTTTNSVVDIPREGADDCGLECGGKRVFLTAGPLRTLRERHPRTFSVVYATLTAILFVPLVPFAVVYDILECVIVNAWPAFVRQVRYEKAMCSAFLSFSARMTRDAWNRRPWPRQVVPATDDEEAGASDDSRSGN